MMIEYSLIGISYTLMPKGMIISQYDVEMLHKCCQFVFSKQDTNLDFFVKEIQESEIYSLRDNVKSSMSYDARYTLKSIYYQILCDFITIEDYCVCGNSELSYHSGGIEWEIDAIGFGELMIDYADIEEIAEYCIEHVGNKRCGHAIMLWGYNSHYDAYHNGYDSESWFIKFIEQKDMKKFA